MTPKSCGIIKDVGQEVFVHCGSPSHPHFPPGHTGDRKHLESKAICLDNENAYVGNFRRRALIATMTVLNDINAAPNAGDRMIP